MVKGDLGRSGCRLWRIRGLPFWFFPRLPIRRIVSLGGGDLGQEQCFQSSLRLFWEASKRGLIELVLEGVSGRADQTGEAIWSRSLQVRPLKPGVGLFSQPFILVFLWEDLGNQPLLHLFAISNA